MYYLNTDFICISIFDPHSDEALELYRLNNYFIIASSFILLVVIVLLIYVSFKFRARPGDAEPRQIKGSKKMELIMVGIPLLMVSFFLYLTIRTMKSTQPPAGNNKPDVVITGHQWWWEVRYPGENVITANEIHVPAGKRLLLQLRSADVIHDWWVPALGPKMDMEPGNTNHLWVTIRKPGIYEGACSEFCGEQHAWMRIKVIAHSPDDYKKWLSEKAKPAAEPVEASARLGAAVFNNATCSNCHAIKGTNAIGQSGPDLTHMASRKTLLAGLMKNNKENLHKWINDPQKVKPGAHMPDFIFKQDTINALVDYLSALK